MSSQVMWGKKMDTVKLQGKERFPWVGFWPEILWWLSLCRVLAVWAFGRTFVSVVEGVSGCQLLNLDDKWNKLPSLLCEISSNQLQTKIEGETVSHHNLTWRGEHEYLLPNLRLNLNIGSSWNWAYYFSHLHFLWWFFGFTDLKLELEPY